MPSFDYDSIGPLPGTLDVKRRGNQVAVVVEDVERAKVEVERTAATYDVVNLNLDEIFEAYVIGKRLEASEGHQAARPGLERVA